MNKYMHSFCWLNTRFHRNLIQLSCFYLFRKGSNRISAYEMLGLVAAAAVKFNPIIEAGFCWFKHIKVLFLIAEPSLPSLHCLAHLDGSNTI